MKNLLLEIARLGIQLEVRDGNLLVNAPTGVLTRDLQNRIRESKQALIQAFQARSIDHSAAPLAQVVPDPANRTLPFPLNDVQYAYWIGRESHFDMGSVSTHFYFECDCADIDLPGLTSAFNKVVRHHDMMRAVTDAAGNQRILETVPDYEFETHGTIPDPHAMQERLVAIRTRLSTRVAKSDTWPLFHIAAAPIDDHRTRLFFSWDFIFLDAWSLLLVFKQWHDCYTDPERTLAPLALSFRDYVLHEIEAKQTPSYLEAKAYWWSRIDALPAGPALPVARKSASGDRHAFRRRRMVLPAATWQALKSRASKDGLTPSSILLAGFTEVLNRWSKSSHYCLNLTLFNRKPVHPDVDSLVGDFTNLLVLEVEGAHEGKPAGKFVERARRLQERFLKDFANREVSAIDVVREMARRRNWQQRAIFPVVFTSTLMLDGNRSDDSSGLERFGKMVWGISQTPQVWLDYQLFEFEGALVINWDAVEDVFEPGVLDAMFEANQTLLASLAADSGIWNADDVLTLPAAQAARRLAYNATAVPTPVALLHTAFVEQAMAAPDRIAILCGERAVSYGQLLAHAAHIAGQLQERDVRPNELVAVIMDKGWEQVVAVFGILLSGAAYLPIDARWPALRRFDVLAQGEARVVLTQASRRETLELPDGVTCIGIDPDAVFAPLSEAPAMSRPDTDLAYVIFTSGSTGRPKGVAIDHRGAHNTVLHINRLFAVGSADSVLGVSELGFDLSVYDIFGVLGRGGRLVIPEFALARDPSHWRALIRSHAISVWNSAPQLMGLLMDFEEASSSADITSLRLVMLSGDWIPTRLPDRIRAAAPACEVVSLGGATEGSIWSIYHPVERVDADRVSIPYGRPLPNQQMHVLDKQLRPCPEYVVGDIHIGGVGVALGYWKDQERTAGRFRVDPVSGEKLYWTGDLGRFTGDGLMEFLGREDAQVKLRGYRVELGEIAACLQSNPLVGNAAALVHDHGGRATLVAYVSAAHPDGAATGLPAAELATELTRFLAERLPEYMVPQHIEVVDALPLSVNGKIDLAALPRHVDAPAPRAGRTMERPESALQERILAVWADVLSVDRLSITDNFFEAGGDSLMLTEVMRRLHGLGMEKLSVADMFAYPSVKSLAQFLSGAADVAATSSDTAAHAGGEHARPESGDIAVIGLAGRFPDAGSIDELWANLAAGRCATRHFSDSELLQAGVRPEELLQPGYVKSGSVLSGMDLFDAAYFGITPRDAEFMDPQQRFMLECAVAAMENAGYASEASAGRVGVFVGRGGPRYMIDNILTRPDVVKDYGMFAIVNLQDKDHAATGISYKLNLTGPSISMNTACSTSLVTVHAACNSLLSGECDMALAGGASFMSTLERSGYVYTEGQISSPDGHCRAFSEQANGVVFGSGVGIVVLKTLEAALRDKDTIHAVIKGTAINNDGAQKVGYTAPSVHGQAAVIAMALQRSGVPADSIQYVEAHGTGTNLGDPIEFNALRKAYGGARADGKAVALGSIKTNIGHLDVAAGVTGLIKVILSLKNKQMVPTLFGEQPSRKIDFADSPFFLNTALREWKSDGGPRRAAVSSFGVGGTNAHAILEEAPPATARTSDAGPQLLTVSAKSQTALDQACRELAQHLTSHPGLSLADVAYTTQQGRLAHRYRRAVAASTSAEAALKLQQSKSMPAPAGLDGKSRNIVFLFPGQGAQRIGATRHLYRVNRVYRNAFDRCAELVLAYCGTDIGDLLYGTGTLSDEARAQALDQTAVTQPLMFSIEYALAQLWMSLGVRPSAMFGHSLGEYVAACLAGVMTVEEALSLVVVRGQLMQSLPGGSMLAIDCGEAQAYDFMDGTGSALAAINGASQCVVSGTGCDIDKVRARVDAAGLNATVLRTSHAFHSAMMDPILDVYRECVSQVQLAAPSIPFISSVSGDWITQGQATDPAYWVEHLRNTVRFHDGLLAVTHLDAWVTLELGPGNLLSKLARAVAPDPARCVASLGDRVQADEEMLALNQSIGKLWVQGVEIDWNAMHHGQTVGRIPLPSYPFERKRFWISPGAHGAAASTVVDTVVAPVAILPQVLPLEADDGYDRPDVLAPFVASSNEIETRLVGMWRDLLGIRSIGVNDNFFELGGDSLMATRLYAKMRTEFGIEPPREKIFALATIKRLYLYIIAASDVTAVERFTQEELNEFYLAIDS